MKLSLMILVLVAGLVASPLVFADSSEMQGASDETVIPMDAPVIATQEAQTAALEEVGNKICPISGEKIIPGKEAKFIYNGKVYNMCCSMCEKDFKKDPEAAVKKLEAAK